MPFLPTFRYFKDKGKVPILHLHDRLYNKVSCIMSGQTVDSIHFDICMLQLESKVCPIVFYNHPILSFFISNL